MRITSESYAVYAVTDRSWLHGRTLSHDVESVLKGGATLLQLREKHLSDDALLSEAFELKALCHRYGVPFVVNDRVDIALACGADGVHIGQGDMPVEEARRILGPEVCIGVSAQTVSQAVAAEKGGADCIGVGAMFPTGTKLDAADVSMNELAAICSAVHIPVVAIGGIHEGNVCQLAGSGVAGVAAVSAFFAGDDCEESTTRMASKIREMLSVPVRRDKGAIVDMDGTLLDTLKYWTFLASEYLSAHGITPDPELRNILGNKEMWEVSAYLKKEYHLPDSEEEITSGLYAAIRRIYDETAPLTPWAKEMIESLHAEGRRMVILTATKQSLVESALERTGLRKYFQEVISSDNLHLEKKDPSAFLFALGRLGTALDETKVIDDAPFAITAAKAAGFYVVGIHEKTWNYDGCEADEWVN